MAIPSQLPQLIAGAKSSALQALALQSGQILTATVIGPGVDGATQVKIRGQLLNLIMPTPMKAGENVRLEVQGNGAQLRLVLQPPATEQRPVPAATLPQATSRVAPALPAMPSAPPNPAQPTTSTPTSTSLPPETLPAAARQMPVTGQPTPVATTGSAVQVPARAVVSPPSSGATAPVAPAISGGQAAQATVVGQPLPAAPAVTNPPVPAVTQAGTQSAAPSPIPYPPSASAVAAQAASHSPAPVQPPAHTPQNAPLAAAAPAMPALPGTAQAALAQMVHSALPQQGAISSLTTALSALAGRAVLPEPVARAAQQVLAGRLGNEGGKLDGATLQAAIRGSGIFQEATLARGQAPAPQVDMKSALLALRQTLTTWLGPQAPVAAIVQIPPPIKGGVPRARHAEAPPVDPVDTPEAIGKHVLERTESALARIRLHQHASLPDTVGKNADWSLDLPVVIGQHQTLMNIQIHRDETDGTSSNVERGWQLRFAMSLPGMGEVGAQVSMRAGTMGVMLWATEPQSAAALDADLEQLRSELMAVGLQPGAVIVRNSPPQPQAAPSGHFVDART